MTPEPIITPSGVRIGEGVPGTSLLRRYIGEAEISPLFCPIPGKPLAELIRQAKSEAKANGFKTVQVERLVYEVEP